MTVRSFLVLCAFTLAVVIATGVTIVRDQRSGAAVGAAQKLFPELLDKSETLEVISLRDAETTLTIQKHDAGWGLKERDGYPVRPDAVRGLVLKLAGLEKMAAKTERAELYSRLGVEEVTAEGARSKEVELLDNDNGVLVRLLVGKSAVDVGEAGGVYVRIPDESRSWLVRGRLAPVLEARDWVDRGITDIPPADVQSVRIIHPDGETIETAKHAVEDDHFALAGLSGAPPPQSAKALDELASVLSGLNLEDLKEIEDIPFADEITIRAMVSTFDGLTVAADLTEHEGRDWIRISAEASPDARASEQSTAREIADRSKGWAYQVSAFAVAPWKKRKADLLEPAGDRGS